MIFTAFRTRMSSRRQGVAAEALEGRAMFSVSIGAPSVVNVSRMPGDQAEGAIAVDPRNPLEMFAASNNDGVSLMGAVSMDGGKTWATRLFATGRDGLPRACCDPSAAFDEYGNLFFTYLGEDSNRAEVLLSTDGGQSFSHIASLVGRADQPTIAAGHGEVWVAFQVNSQGPPPRGAHGVGPIASAGALAYGARVIGPGRVSAFGKARVVTGPPGTNVGDIAIGPAGQVMVGYQSPSSAGPSTLFVRLDPDGLGPKAFGPPVAVGVTAVGSFDAIPAQPRRTIDAEVGLAYDRSGGPFAGRVYMVYTDEFPAGSGNTDVMLRYSDNDGQTWSAPRRVNDDATTNSQFLPRIAVDASTGAVALTWYDSRNDAGVASTGNGTDNSPNNEAQFWGAVGMPTPSGVAFSANFPITTGFSNTNVTADANDYGDYTGLAFAGGVLSPVWADNSNSTGDNPDGVHGALDLYTAQVAVGVSNSQSRTLLGQFGAVGGQLSLTAPGGKRVRLSLSSGSGYVFADGSNLDLQLRNTDSRSILTITPGAGPGKLTLGNVAVAGPLGALRASRCDLSGTLFILGTSNVISLGNVSGGTIAVSGPAGKISVASLSSARVLSGAGLGFDALIGGGDDAYGIGSIAQLSVRGAVTSSFVAAGFAPADGLFDNTSGAILGGAASAIQSIVIRGGVDASTRLAAGAFASVRLPARVNPAADPRFRVG